MSDSGKDDSSQRGEQDPIEFLAAVFPAIKEKGYVPDNIKLKKAVKIIEYLRNYAAMYTLSERQNTHTREHRLFIAEGALQVIHIMDKHYQQMPEPVQVPRIKLCDNEPGLDLSKIPPLQYLEKRCETNSDWFRFAVHTARVFISCNRTDQARELIDLAEKRLLKLKQRPLYFSQLDPGVHSSPRRSWSRSFAVSRPGQEQLEWYLTAPVDDDLSLLKLDQMHGARWYLTLKCDSPPSLLRQLASAVVECRAPQEMDLSSSVPRSSWAVTPKETKRLGWRSSSSTIFGTIAAWRWSSTWPSPLSSLDSSSRVVASSE